jgi:glycosyltransferase involved in cell wall biosynthesis
VLAQTFTDIDLIISDDGSQDKTWEICCRYKEIDRRIKLFRQDRNLYYMNFGFLLEQSSAPYFAWLAGDDTWSPTYLEECIKELNARPDAVGCVSRCQFIVDGKPTSLSNGTASLEQEWEHNVVTYLREPGDNTRMYGVFRVHALKASFPHKVMHAYDWALSAATLRYGKHIELPKVLMTRQQTPREKYARSVKRDHRSWVFRLFPVLRMSQHLIFQRKIPVTPKVLRALLRLNLVMHVEYMKFIHPEVLRHLKFFYKRIDSYLIKRL